MKNIYFKRLLTIVFVTFSLNSLSQSKVLGIGDVCPDVMIKHIINYETNEARISDFKGKLLILDFWATWCTPCISMMLFSDSLQKKFTGRIQILPVTDQDSVTVSEFLKNMNRVNHLMPPSATGDKILKSLFKHTEIPHYVWIDKNSKIIGLTGAEQLTANNIESLLNGKDTEIQVKEDVVKVIDETKPMFTVGNEIIKNNEIQFERVENSSLLFHSVITKYIDGFGCETGSFENKLECKNNSIGGLFRFAAGNGKLKNLMLNSTIWEVTNPAIKIFTDSAAIEMERELKRKYWMKNYTFCYELKFPSSLNYKKYDLMLADINNYFGSLYNIEGRIEIRKIKCLALVQIDKTNSFKSLGSKENYIFDRYHLKLTNQPMSLLTDFLGINLDFMPPLVDESNYDGKIDIDLSCDLQDINSINKALQKYGLQLQEKLIDKEMIVIKDKLRLK